MIRSIHIVTTVLAAAMAAGAATNKAALRPYASAHAATNAPPKRIISFSPALTEILFAVGAGSNIAGVAEYCDYPAEARACPRVGGIANPNIEAILTLKPDLVALQGRMDVMRRFCDKYRIPMLAMELETWRDITNGIERMGDLTGCGARARGLVADMARRWEAVRTRAAARAAVPAFICVGRDVGRIASCMTASAHSFLAEALAVAGGSNICADVVGFYPNIAAEVLSARRPIVIFELRPGERMDETQRAQMLRDWSPLTTVPAVRRGNVLLLTNDFLLIAGPRVVDTAQLLDDLLGKVQPQ